jgi:phosphoenolpyruvate carboxykinase (GTP)
MKSYKELDQWIKEMAALLEPDDIYYCDGTEEENSKFLKILVDQGKATMLNPQKRPNSYAFFSDPSDVARVENRTFIASNSIDDAGPTNNWIEPNQLKDEMRALYKGAMKGRTMYVIPFMMGHFNSVLSKIGIQLTDSLYVVVNMRIMTRMGKDVLKKLEEVDQFIPCLHSVGYPLDENKQDLSWPSAPIEKKYIAHFPEEKLIWSYGSGYGGNALLGKKCLALRIASVIAKEEMWMAEHMLILKITNPEGRTKYVLGAFPSACGKTNLSMLVPTLPNWKVETVGDDIAWIWMKDDGRLYAINPEKGFFGVAKGTSYQSNPNAMMSIRKNTIFTNVALTDDLDVWWEDIDGPTPDHLIDWKKEDWTKDKKTPAAHPNSRFTVAAIQCPSIADEWENPEGVLISAILIGGRRPQTIPLVHEALNWNHGVFMGSMMGSEITQASISNQYGTVRRDPFAMLPFIGYHIGDYLKHWLDMGKRSNDALLPKIYFVNWFRKDDKNEYLWPGFGHNSRVLKWIFERSDGTAGGHITPIGIIPNKEDIDIRGLPMKPESLDELLNVDIDKWLLEVESIKEYYQTIGEKLPKRLKNELLKLEQRLIFKQSNAIDFNVEDE